jgi:steroid delta-isomerase-like uncharacterized protein
MKKLLIIPILSIALFSCTNQESGKEKTTDYNNARMRAFYDQVMNAHNPEMVDSFITQDFVDHQPFPGYPPGMDGLKAGLKDYFMAYPDLKFNINYVKSFGDTVIAHFNMMGTNSGSMMGMPATNKPINIEGVDIVVLKDGKAVEHWGYMEESKMMEQLGMNNPPMEMPMQDTKK